MKISAYELGNNADLKDIAEFLRGAFMNEANPCSVMCLCDDLADKITITRLENLPKPSEIELANYKTDWVGAIRSYKDRVGGDISDARDALEFNSKPKKL